MVKQEKVITPKKSVWFKKLNKEKVQKFFNWSPVFSKSGIKVEEIEMAEENSGFAGALAVKTNHGYCFLGECSIYKNDGRRGIEAPLSYFFSEKYGQATEPQKQEFPYDFFDVSRVSYDWVCYLATVNKGVTNEGLTYSQYYAGVNQYLVDQQAEIEKRKIENMEASTKSSISGFARRIETGVVID